MMNIENALHDAETPESVNEYARGFNEGYKQGHADATKFALEKINELFNRSSQQ